MRSGIEARAAPNRWLTPTPTDCACLLRTVWRSSGAARRTPHAKTQILQVTSSRGLLEVEPENCPSLQATMQATTPPPHPAPPTTDQRSAAVWIHGSVDGRVDGDAKRGLGSGPQGHRRRSSHLPGRLRRAAVHPPLLPPKEPVFCRAHHRGFGLEREAVPMRAGTLASRCYFRCLTMKSGQH